ncbi:RNA 2'-phosphotransferase [Mariniblastus sp.]|nr:RNA 2'-phosphotransferase [Mariniblastus sp.]MDB4373001.1 RNA 2'-phosphotransferase [Mariniblastus sp.]
MISGLSGKGGETKVSIWVKLPTMNRRLTKVSKYLSFVLRHHPEAIGLKLDPERWANVDELLQNAKASGKSITLTQVQDVVTLDEQKMFVFSEDGLRIRAN